MSENLLPGFRPEVDLSSPWGTLVASRANWLSWLTLARREAPEATRAWADTSGCEGCVHLDRSASWCNLAAFPAAYNPILTPSAGLIGMACGGAGKEPPGYRCPCGAMLGRDSDVCKDCGSYY